ncbi:MAG: restriction endonuclease subunit S, partial [Bacilli bacterium]|nr:restriction endonuclease subunit S [Bacilli bacterium]
MKDLVQNYKETPLGTIPIDWETKKLSDIFEFKNGLNKEKKYFGDGSPLVNYVDVYKNRQINGDIVKGKVKVTKSEKERFDVKDGDVFFTRTSETINEIGYSSVIVNPRPETVFSGFILRAREKNSILDNLYKKYCFSTHLARKEIITKSTITTRALTSGKLLGDVYVIVPPYNEQKKIAEILSTWDDAIEISLKEISEYKKLKESLYQKIYSYSEAPRTAIKNLIKKNREQDNKGINDVNYLEIGDIDIYDNTYQLKEKTAIKGSKIGRKGNIVVSTVRPTRGAITILKSDMYVSSALAIIDLNNSVNQDYIYHQLLAHRFLNTMGSLSTGSTYPTVSHDDVLSYKVIVPDID